MLLSHFSDGCIGGLRQFRNAVMLSRAKHLLLFGCGGEKQILRGVYPERSRRAQDDPPRTLYTNTKNGLEFTARFQEPSRGRKPPGRKFAARTKPLKKPRSFVPQSLCRAVRSVTGLR